ncbi:tricarballylate utilization 4Fe-4S protein TcuB [Roseobacter sp. S98]|uniref:tricarballylate utilization 4Fe-4S protein TcuB n=1 Tax=Roseobacter algicola (ex Choi et al. 2025) (nom. illeg.) TaxID=3092138 RepID=UPI0035C7813F
MYDAPSTETYEEARRQLGICNACRYCEGYCSAFPAITRLRTFADADITQIANLCHNCRGCYYACQYTEPHEFALNLPRALAEVRTESWQDHVWPGPVAHLFLKNAAGTVLATLAGFAGLFMAIRALAPASGEGFYAVLSHAAMVAIFAPAFVLPLLILGFSLHGYWRSIGGQRITWSQVTRAFGRAARMKDLEGGHGEGCNFEKGERFSSARRYAHHSVMYGFLLCFASTVSGTVLHYAFGWPAPYPFLSPPKLLGVPGGILLTLGCVWMLVLRQRADAGLSDPATRSADTAFIALLGFIGASGLALYWLGKTPLMPPVLALHLGAVAAFFLLTPYTKMAHGFFRLAALIRDAQLRA